ncbi:hypothetical protein A3K80_01345 [Candidatus Bathyarchaeota archaeon RBG_13_38_9]|nr:MAG: hypothetical protein A3K80_01345 [Candidatus Bathyarchaeota archaeon RBG_13_38_9]
MNIKNFFQHNLSGVFSELDPRRDIYNRIFIYLLLVSFILRILWLDRPIDALIFDEKHYVNAVRVILGLPHDPDRFVDAPAGMDPNSEHPPLAKGIIALSILVFGNNGFGFRIPSVIFGTISILIFYLLVKRLSGNPKLALIASFLYSFDSLVFVQSRIAMLDIFMLTFMILGFYWWISDRIFLGATALALSTLCKFSAMFGVVVVIAYLFLKRNGGGEYDLKGRLKKMERFTIFYLIVFFLLFAIIDYLYGPYKNPFTHLEFILKFTSKITRTSFEGIMSYPWQWLINEVQIPYLVTSGKVTVKGEYLRTVTLIDFKGVMNPAILFLTIPAILYVGYSYYRKRDNFTLFTLLWFALTYLPYYPMVFLGNRVMYIFYFLSTIPAVCLAIAYGLLELRNVNVKIVRFHNILIVIYLMLVLVGFYIYFPFKTIP